MKLNVLYLFTHDSIYVGKDGVTHQPVEQLAQLRSMVNLNVFRPADSNELLAAYQYYFDNGGTTAFALSRQKMPVIEGKYKEAMLGGYILRPAKKEADIVLFATGSEVGLALSVAGELSKKYDVSVVSMPCIEVFEKQSILYKNKVLQKNAKVRVAIEASNDNIWYRYIGMDGLFIGVDDYQGSGDGKAVYENAGFTEKDIVKKISKKMIK